MKPSLNYLAAIVAATATFGAFGTALSDSLDAHARAERLLSRTSSATEAQPQTRAPSSAASADAQAHDVAMGDHPAVVVARTYSKRGIDPNHFIVLHPAL